MRPANIVLILIAFLTACSTPPDDIPAQDICTTWADVQCDRKLECDQSLDRDLCVSSTYAGCCDSYGDCSWPATPMDRWPECIADLDIMTCEQVLRGDIPHECLIDADVF